MLSQDPSFITFRGTQLSTYHLSPREAEIVELAIDGLTNDGIAARLGLSLGTVNTYWLRIRLKVGGSGRTDSVAKVIKERAEVSLREANSDKDGIVEILAAREQTLVELQASIALLRLALDQIKSAVWAADRDLTLYLLANGELPTVHCGVTWEVGKTVYEIFKSTDRNHPPIAAHLAALEGEETVMRLEDEFKNMMLRAMPLRDESQEIMGCIGIMNHVAA
ncbi:MAG: hypothetical protein HONBIEJF_02705 [Fimbriimonadaceae bacterium]|nr:hypothetical protein [Fimbriimonadaceae bacterium]